MELLKLLKTQNLTQFSNIKNVLEQEPYNLIIKEDHDYPNLYMITYDRNTSNMNSPVVKCCRGIILEKETNKVVCYTFNKSVDVIDELDTENLRAERSVDGTQIRLFYYNGEWCHSTTRCIDAKKSRWFSRKSFYDLYRECLDAMGGQYNYDDLDKSCCYSFVICHPENRIVLPYEEPHLVHVLTRNLETLEEVDFDLGIEKPLILTSFNSYEDVIYDSENTTSLEEGIMLCNNDGRRMKIKNSSYMKVKGLQGNTNNMFYRYLQLNYDNMLDTYLSFYPEHMSHFALYELDFRKLAGEIHRIYMNKHVHRVNFMIPSHFKTMIYKLHGKYLETHRQTNINKIIDELNSLHPSQVCHMYNKTFRPHHPFHTNIVEENN